MRGERLPKTFRSTLVVELGQEGIGHEATVRRAPRVDVQLGDRGGVLGRRSTEPPFDRRHVRGGDAVDAAGRRRARHVYGRPGERDGVHLPRRLHPRSAIRRTPLVGRRIDLAGGGVQQAQNLWCMTLYVDLNLRT